MGKKIAVIGGGIAGLTFAQCLSGSEYDIHVFEKKDEFGEVGAAISVFPNALCVMDDIGLLDLVLEKSGRFKNMYLKTSDGTILSKSSPKSDYPVICTHRSDLHQALLTDLEANLYTGHELTNLKSTEDGKAHIDFSNGHSEVFDAVIGADGINSVVRTHVIDDGKPIFRGYNVWRGITKSDFDTGYASETYGRGKRVGIVPIKDGFYGWWATCNEGFMQDDSPEGSKKRLRTLFGDWHDPIPELINNCGTILKNSVGDREPHKGWTKGKITLLGDAAHPTTPNLGQGGCMAIEGAFILAKSISKYGLTPKAYSTYENLQFPRSADIVKQSLRLGKLGQISDPFLISLRNMSFKLTPSFLAMKLIDKYFSYRVTELKL